MIVKADKILSPIFCCYKVRSILLRGFDQQIAEKIGEHMEKKCGINFIRPCVPTKLEKVGDGEEKGKIRVHAKYQDGTAYEDVFDTVMFAVGREAETAKLGLSSVGVTINPKNKKIVVNEGMFIDLYHSRPCFRFSRPALAYLINIFI